jgi:hypothetical protein
MRKEDSLPGIADLPRLTAAQLQDVHETLFGTTHPISNCQHLRRKIAWHMQAAKEGGLPESIRQFAIAVARGAELRSRISENASRRRGAIPPDGTASSVVGQTHDARLPMPGSLIVKKYKGRTLVVKVLDEAFEYEGRRFTSLSAIAGEITGTRWNGFAFFGLAKESERGH